MSEIFYTPKSFDSERGNPKHSNSIERKARPKVEHKPKLAGRGIRVLAIGYLVLNGIIGVSYATTQKSEKSPKKPDKVVSETYKMKEKGHSFTEQELKESLIRKENTHRTENLGEKLSQKTYEVFLNSQKLMDRLKQNRSVYDQAAKVTGVDWKVLAAIHYREGEMSSSHSTVSGEKLGSKNPDTGKTYNSLLESAVETGTILKRNLKFAYNRNYSLDEETIKKETLAYNRGGGYPKEGVGPEKSPYVMNFYNEKYDSMVWPNISAEPANLRGQVNEMYGALTVYKILEQADVEGRL